MFSHDAADKSYDLITNLVSKFVVVELPQVHALQVLGNTKICKLVTQKFLHETTCTSLTEHIMLLF